MHTTFQNDLALDKRTWLGRVRRFMEALGDETVTVDRHLRKAYHLQCLAPAEFKPLMVPIIEESHLETLLERSAYASAAELITGVSVQSSLEVGAATGYGSPTGAHPAEDDHSVVAALGAWAVSCLRPNAMLH